MSKVKVFIGVGHGGTDYGAVGYLKEKDVNLMMAKACRDYLERAGCDVLMSRTVDEMDTISEEIYECNNFRPVVAVDIHNNAGGGEGFEAWVSLFSQRAEKLGAFIEAEVLNIGQKSRGVKTREGKDKKDYYAFNRNTLCPAVILEGAFVDSKLDSAKIDTQGECEKFGEAYARGILKYLGIALPSDVIYKVQVGAFSDKSNAERLCNNLKANGYQAFITSV